MRQSILIRSYILIQVIFLLYSYAYAQELTGGYHFIEKKLIDDGTSVYCRYNRSSEDVNGNINVVYLQGVFTYPNTTSGRPNLYFNRYNNESKKWLGAIQIDLKDNDLPSGVYSQRPTLLTDLSGNITVIYEQIVNYPPSTSNFTQLYSVRYNAISGSWTKPFLIDGQGPLSSIRPDDYKAAIDNAGNILVVFRRNGYPTKIELSIFNSTTNSWIWQVTDFEYEVIDLLLVENNDILLITRQGSSTTGRAIHFLKYSMNTNTVSDLGVLENSESYAPMLSTDSCDAKNGVSFITYTKDETINNESHRALYACNYSNQKETYLIDIQNEQWDNICGDNVTFMINNMRIKVDQEGNCILLYSKYVYPQCGYVWFAQYYNSQYKNWTNVSTPLTSEVSEPKIILDHNNDFYINYYINGYESVASCILNKDTLNFTSPIVTNKINFHHELILSKDKNTSVAIYADYNPITLSYESLYASHFAINREGSEGFNPSIIDLLLND